MTREELRRDVIARLRDCLIDIDGLGGWSLAAIDVNQAIEHLMEPPEADAVG